MKGKTKKRKKLLILVAVPTVQLHTEIVAVVSPLPSDTVHQASVFLLQKKKKYQPKCSNYKNQNWKDNDSI